jgi:hypothetical protein
MRYLLVAISCGLLSSCATSADVPAALSEPLDTTVQHQVAAARQAAAHLGAGKVKFKGPVTIQIGASNTATTTAIAKAKAPVASAPHATATESTTKSGPPWWVYAGGAALALLAGWLLRSKWG